MREFFSSFRPALHPDPLLKVLHMSNKRKTSVLSGMILERSLRKAEERIDDYKGQLLTPHRHKEMKRRFMNIRNIVQEIIWGYCQSLEE